ncbi:MAG: peptidoglycan editing factor PgeF [Lachnospiraceae bacterium]|nr:peptidoglycan editing factor PgeF [Lachnospiraceae bacterium]
MIKKEMSPTTEYKKIGNVGVIEYLRLNEFPWLINAFSTREGGVSQGQFSCMNLSKTVGDDPENVEENFRIFGKAIGVDPENMVYSDQTHTDHVMRVGAEHKGMGIIRDRNFHDIDGLITNEPGICLVTSFADCVPLYFLDPVHRAIGLTHSGWRGTVAKIGAKTIDLMGEEYGSDPSDMICCIGPCIGKECYEVSEDVVKEFSKAFNSSQCERIYFPRKEYEGKYLLDLPQANYEIFVECGLSPENIFLPDLCTACNHDTLHSHRASGGKRGGMCAFLMINV